MYKGKERDESNSFRGMSIHSMADKVYGIVLNVMMNIKIKVLRRKALEKMRGCVDQIFPLNILVKIFLDGDYATVYVSR